VSRFIVLRKPLDLQQVNLTENVLVNLDDVQWVEPTRTGGVVKFIMQSGQWICVRGTVEHFRQIVAAPVAQPLSGTPVTIGEPESNG